MQALPADLAHLYDNLLTRQGDRRAASVASMKLREIEDFVGPYRDSPIPLRFIGATC